jgi:uncharacterized membrane protein
MARLLLRILLVLALLAGMVFVAGLLMPRNYSATATITIEAPIDDVFPQVNRTKSWADWSPWSPTRIDGMTVEYKGPAEGVGAKQVWQDPRPDQRFDGGLEITGSKKNEKIEYTATIGAIPMDGFFEFKESDGMTNVSWTGAGKLPKGSLYGWFGLTYNGMLQMELKNSLGRLKEKIESRRKPQPNADFKNEKKN